VAKGRPPVCGKGDGARGSITALRSFGWVAEEGAVWILKQASNSSASKLDSSLYLNKALQASNTVEAIDG
jgi:hypothetical protein